MLALTLALFALQPLAGDIAFGQANRDSVQAALARAQVAVDRIAYCSRHRPDRDDWDRDYGARLQQLADMFSDAEELYPDVTPTDGATILAETPAPTCADDAVRAEVAEAGRALDAAEALMRADAPRLHGLWLGNLRLCGDRVEAVEEGSSEFAGDSPVIVHFSLAFAPRVRALTAAFVRRRLPILLDGRIVVRPTVNEPVSWAISISSVDGTSFEQIRRAAATPC